MADSGEAGERGVAAGGSGSDPETAGKRKDLGLTGGPTVSPQAVHAGRKPDGRRRQEFHFRSWR